MDSFRHFYPKKERQYSFWSYMGNARAKNVGWYVQFFLFVIAFCMFYCRTFYLEVITKLLKT